MDNTHTFTLQDNKIPFRVKAFPPIDLEKTLVNSIEAFEKAFNDALERNDIQSLYVIWNKFYIHQNKPLADIILSKYFSNEKRYLEILDLALKLYADQETLEKALFLSVYHHDISLLKRVAKHIDIKSYTSKTTGDNLLHKAIRVYNPKAVDNLSIIINLIHLHPYLLFTQNVALQTPLDCLKSVILKTAESIDLQASKLFLSLNPSAIDAVDEKGNTLLHKAVNAYIIHEESIIPFITYILQLKPGLLLVENNEGKTPINCMEVVLFKVVKNADLETLEFLCNYVPSISIQDAKGNTLLHKAIEYRPFGIHRMELIDFIISKDTKLLDIENNSKISPRRMMQ